MKRYQQFLGLIFIMQSFFCYGMETKDKVLKNETVNPNSKMIFVKLLKRTEKSDSLVNLGKTKRSVTPENLSPRKTSGSPQTPVDVSDLEVTDYN